MKRQILGGVMALLALTLGGVLPAQEGVRAKTRHPVLKRGRSLTLHLEKPTIHTRSDGTFTVTTKDGLRITGKIKLAPQSRNRLRDDDDDAPPVRQELGAIRDTLKKLARNIPAKVRESIAKKMRKMGMKRGKMLFWKKMLSDKPEEDAPDEEEEEEFEESPVMKWVMRGQDSDGDEEGPAHGFQVFGPPWRVRGKKMPGMGFFMGPWTRAWAKKGPGFKNLRIEVYVNGHKVFDSRRGEKHHPNSRRGRHERARGERHHEHEEGRCPCQGGRHGMHHEGPARFRIEMRQHRHDERGEHEERDRHERKSREHQRHDRRPRKPRKHSRSGQHQYRMFTVERPGRGDQVIKLHQIERKSHAIHLAPKRAPQKTAPRGRKGQVSRLKTVEQQLKTVQRMLQRIQRQMRALKGTRRSTI